MAVASVAVSACILPTWPAASPGALKREVLGFILTPVRLEHVGSVWGALNSPVSCPVTSRNHLLGSVLRQPEQLVGVDMDRAPRALSCGSVVPVRAHTISVRVSVMLCVVTPVRMRPPPGTDEAAF